ncbi:MAG: serine/threonine protein kinase [Archangium sp.]|nr:serine/threonine protein kinase [Archangium sp.]
MTRDKVSGDALFILKSLRDNARAGRSNKLADVKVALENSVSLEFDSYFFFLRKFHYIAMDREAQLKLTDNGERAVDGDDLDAFTTEVADFFADQISGQGESDPGSMTMIDAPAPRPPPPPATDILLEEQPKMPQPPPPPRGGRKPPADDPPTQAQPMPHVTAPEMRPGGAGFSPTAPAPLPLTAVASSASQVQGRAAGDNGDSRYQKLDAIGQGPLGTAFKGKQNALGVDVAVKEIKDIFGYFSFLQRSEVIKRLKKELCAQAQVRHPGVVAIIDQNTDVARPYFVMELCKSSLREKLDAASGRGLAVPLAMRYFLQMSYALRAAHQQGLTHHNIKPENVLFDAYGNAKLGDFGLSRVIEVDQSKGMPQVFVGTGGMGYMSPELMGRTKEAGASSDVYGLGILLYEMLTGQLPGRRSPLPSEVNTEVPAKLDPIFDKMTHDRKESRYPDFEAMLDDFYKAFSGKEYLGKGDLLLWSETA